MNTKIPVIQIYYQNGDTFFKDAIFKDSVAGLVI